MARKVAPPLPIQAPLFRPDDLKPESGLHFFNQWCSSVVVALNQLFGITGKTVLPSGIDVQGASVTGLSSPTDPSDAISSAHAESKYAPSVTASQFDVGGPHALNGLTSISLQMTQAYTGTIALAKLTGGGSNGSISVANGLIISVTPPS
jgi:hypothetical protein